LRDPFASGGPAQHAIFIVVLTPEVRSRGTGAAGFVVVVYILANDRLYAAVAKASGAISNLTLDGQDLLGPQSGSTGIGPYLDCQCIPSGFYNPGLIAPKYRLISGVDSSNTAYGGIVMSETHPPTGLLLEQYWFLREGETGLHTFSRVAYYNATTPFLRNLAELRTLFRPNTPLWTHLLTHKNLYAPLPSSQAKEEQVVVQDATWYLGNTPEDAYVEQFADYFTKYTFHDSWRDHDVHGMYADGSTSADNATFGSWLVMNTKDTYFGGPLHSDLTVDGIVYNYLVSNHHGEGTPNITDGFDRTFGPQYFHFNKGAPGTSMETLRQEALEFYSPTWNSDFYDSIAEYVPNYVPSSNRTTWKGNFHLPAGAIKPVAILSQNGVYFQDNSLDPTAYQYWADINTTTGEVSIPAVKAGTYRLSIYAEGIFGQYYQDDIQVVAGVVHTTNATWREESAGTEIWRIGTPDMSGGEFKHGYAPDTTHPLHPEQYRIYWAVYDFPDEFPDGLTYTIGASDPAADFNYVHWSMFGGYGNSLRPEPVWENINNWTLLWDMESRQLEAKETATLTVQLAGAKTAAGNTDVYNASQPYSNLAYTVVVNGHQLEPWVIPSCAIRSSVSCYNVAQKFTFDPDFLVAGKNEIVLSLPANATDYESAVLSTTVYVQYDALRLEVE
ncbi:rhamnogalacturonate lyase, partial [Diplocarpon rosae]